MWPESPLPVAPLRRKRGEGRGEGQAHAQHHPRGAAIHGQSLPPPSRPAFDGAEFLAAPHPDPVPLALGVTAANMWVGTARGRQGEGGTGMTRIDNARRIRAPRGTQLSAKSWLT